MLLLAYDPNVKSVQEYAHDAAFSAASKPNYAISLVSPYGNQESFRKIYEQTQFIFYAVAASLVPMPQEARDQFDKEAKRLGLPGLVMG